MNLLDAIRNSEVNLVNNFLGNIYEEIQMREEQEVYFVGAIGETERDEYADIYDAVDMAIKLSSDKVIGVWKETETGQEELCLMVYQRETFGYTEEYGYDWEEEEDDE